MTDDQMIRIAATSAFSVLFWTLVRRFYKPKPDAARDRTQKWRNAGIKLGRRLARRRTIKPYL